MSKIRIKPRNLLLIVSNLEKKHKVITYASLLFLTVSTYFLRTENQRIKLDFQKLKENNTDLQNNMVIFNRNYENFPLPVWQKVKRGNKFIMEYINPEYIKRFGHLFNYNEYEQIGKSNFDNFPEDLAKIYYKNDSMVAATGKEMEMIEVAEDINKNIISLKNIKWRDINDNNDTLIYGMIKEFIEVKKQ